MIEILPVHRIGVIIFIVIFFLGLVQMIQDSVHHPADGSGSGLSLSIRRRCESSQGCLLSTYSLTNWAGSVEHPDLRDYPSFDKGQ